MTSVLGRKVDEPKIVRRSELSSAKQSAVHAGLTEAWTLFGEDRSVHQKLERAAYKQAPANSVRGRAPGLKPATSVQPHARPAPPNRNGVRLAWEDPRVETTTAASDSTGQKGDRTHPVASSAKQPLKKPLPATTATPTPTGDHDSLPGLVQKSFPPYSNAQAVFGPPVDFKNPSMPQHVSTRPLEVKQAADTQKSSTRKTTSHHQVAVPAKPQAPATTQASIASIELPEDTVAALRATIEKQKQATQAKASLPSDGDRRQLGFQTLSEASVNTTVLDSFHPMPPSSPPPPSSHGPTADLLSRQLHGPSSPVQCKEEAGSDVGGTNSARVSQERRRKTVAVPAPQSYSGFSTRGHPPPPTAAAAAPPSTRSTSAPVPPRGKPPREGTGGPQRRPLSTRTAPLTESSRVKPPVYPRPPPHPPPAKVRKVCKTLPTAEGSTRASGIITTSSWRDGKKLAESILARDREGLSSTNGLPATNGLPSASSPTGHPHVPEDGGPGLLGSGALLDGVAKGAEGGGGEGGGYSGLPESAVRVLQDLESEGGLAPNRKPKVDDEPKTKARSRLWREGASFPHQPLSKKAKANPEPAGPPPKARETKPEVKKYLQMKQEEQKRKAKEEKVQKEKAQKEKEEKLKELFQRQRSMIGAGSRNRQKPQQASTLLPPSVDDMASDSEFLRHDHTSLLHPASGSDHSPLGSSQLSPTSSLASSRGLFSASSSTSHIPVRVLPRPPSGPAASYNSRRVVHPSPYSTTPYPPYNTTPYPSGHLPHSSTSLKPHPQSHLPPHPPTSKPAVMYQLPQSDHGNKLDSLTQTALRLKERIAFELEHQAADHTSLPPKGASLPSKGTSHSPSSRGPSVRCNLMVKMVAASSPSELPGVGSLQEHAQTSRQRAEEEAAASKIQAAYRGYRVRRGLGGRGWYHMDLGHDQDGPSAAGHVASVPVTTVTRASPTSLQEGLGTHTAGLRVTTAPGNLGTLPAPPQATPANVPPVLFATTPPADLPWQQAVGDTYSVINVFNRQQEKLRETLGPRGALPQRSTHASSQLPNESQYSYTMSFEQSPTREEEASHRSHTTGSKKAATPTRADTAIQGQYHASNHSSHNNTLTSQTTPRGTPTPRHTTPSPTADQSTHNGLHRDSTHHADEPDVGDDGSPSISSLSECSVTDGLTASLGAEPVPHPSKTTVREELSPVRGRLSPRSLQLKLQTELNLLESVEESMRHLSGVEETRAVAMAQSETATLAQLLTSEKQLREQEARTLHSRTKAAEAVVMERRREEEERKREALREEVGKMASDARRLQEEAARKAAEHSAVLAKLHEESSQVARNITAATVAMVEATQQQMKVAQNVAVSVAVAATQEAMKTALGRPESQKTKLSSKSPQRPSPSPSGSRQSHSYHSDLDHSTKSKALQSQGTSRPPTTEPEVDRTLQSQTRTSRPPSTELEVDRTLQSQTGTSRPPSTEPEVDRTLLSQIGTSRPPSTEPESKKTLQSQIRTSRPQSTERSHGVTSPSPSTVDTASDMEGEVETEEVEEEGGEDSERASSVLAEEIDQSSRSLHPPLRQQLSSVENSDSEAFVLSQGDHSRSSTPSGEHHADPKEDSFLLFTTRMVEQYLQEEELRAQHQATLLKLRKKAIEEKAQAELEWLRIKKEKLERKGAIDMISRLIEKEEKVLKQLKLEQAEIRRLREVQRLASQERRLILLEHQQIGKLNKTTNYYREKVRCYGSPTPDRDMSVSPSLHQAAKDVRGTQSSIAEDLHTSTAVPAEDLEHVSTPASSICSPQMTDVQPHTPKASADAPKQAEASRASTMSPVTASKTTPTTDSPTLKQLKKIASADAEKYLAHRERVLLRRRRAAEAALRQQEKLLKREQTLDVEEEEVTKLVGKALRSFEQRLGPHRRTKSRTGHAAAEGPGEETRAGTDDSRPDSTVMAPSPDLLSVARSIASEGLSHTQPVESINEDLSHPIEQVDEDLSHPIEQVDEDLSHPIEQVDEDLSHPIEQVDEDLSHPIEQVDEDLSHPTEQVDEDLSHPIEQVDEDLSHPIEQVDEDLSHPTEQVDEEEQWKEGLDHSKQSGTEGNTVATQLDHTPSKTLPRASQTSQTSVHKEYNNDTFESFHPTSVPKITSTPSLAAEETLNITESISEGAVSGVSSVEGRIRVLKEQLKQRKEEARRLQSEQKRRKKALLKEQEEQLKKQLEAVDKVILATKMSSLPPSDTSSPSSTAGSPLPDQVRDTTASPPISATASPLPPCPRSPPISATAEQFTPQPISEQPKDIVTPLTTPSHPHTFSQPIQTQMPSSHHDSVEEMPSSHHDSVEEVPSSHHDSVEQVQMPSSHHDSVEEVLSESHSSSSSVSEGQQRDLLAGGSPGMQEGQQRDLLAGGSPGMQEGQQRDLLAGGSPGMQEENPPSERYTSETFEKPSQSSPSSDKAGPQEELSGLREHKAEPQEEKSVLKDVMPKVGSESIGDGEGSLDEETLEEEEDDDDFYNIQKKVETRRDLESEVEQPMKGVEPMGNDETEIENETIMGEVEKEGSLKEEREKKELVEDEREEEEESIQEVEEEEEEDLDEDTEGEEERFITTEMEAKGTADINLHEELTVLEHGPEAPSARSPMGVEAAMATQIPKITEEGPVSPDLAGDVGLNQPTAPPSCSTLSAATVLTPLAVDGIEGVAVEAVAKDLVQDMANEAFETMYQLFRAKRGRAMHSQPEDRAPVVTVKQDRNVTLTLEQKADRITDDLLALLVQSETMYMNGLRTARGIQQSPDHVETKGRNLSAPPDKDLSLLPLSPSSLHQCPFEANIHMPHLESVHSPPPCAHPHPPGAHSPPAGAHPPTPQLSPPQVELTPPPPSALLGTHHMVNSDRQSINTVCEYAWRAFQRIGAEGLHSTDTHRCPQELYSRLYNARGLGKEEACCRQHYVDLVYNVAMETIKELHPKQLPEPVWSCGCTKGGKLITRDLKSPAAELALLQNKVCTALTLGQKPLALSGIKFLNGMKRPGGREIDFVDMLLIKELRDEEPSWIDYSRDETAVKMAVADGILDELIKETVVVLTTIEGRRNRSKH